MSAVLLLALSASSALASPTLCDPTAGTMRINDVLHNASNFTECGPLIGMITANLTSNAPAGTTCAAGFQCMPTTSDCTTGVCEACAYGKHCPEGTSNRFGASASNECPAGFSCAQPTVLSECEAGHVCATGTFDGGVVCPHPAPSPEERTHEWGLSLYCPAGSTDYALCEAGYLCHNTSYREPCPAGHKCVEGANATLPYARSALAIPSVPARDAAWRNGALVFPHTRLPPRAVRLLPFGGLVPPHAHARVHVSMPACRHVAIADIRTDARRHACGRCLTDWLGSTSAESRCPVGSQAEPERWELVVLPAVALLLVRAVAGLCALKSARRALRCLTCAGHRRLRDRVSVQPALGAEGGATAEGGTSDAHKSAVERWARLRTKTASITLANAIAGKSAHLSAAFDLVCKEVYEHDKSGVRRLYSVKKGGSGKSMASAAVKGVKTGTGVGEHFMSLSFSNLCFDIGRNRVLDGLCAQVRQGELVALMGESGSGKTTLLNIMGGRAAYGKTSGELHFNGSHWDPTSNGLSFVPQAHLVFKELTVYENLKYSSLLRLTPAVSTEAREALVWSTLKLLGLTQCAHYLCDKSGKFKLSGGQMRRVGIGAELVTVGVADDRTADRSPSTPDSMPLSPAITLPTPFSPLCPLQGPLVLLLDEPTSSLDAVNTRLVVEALRMLANRGMPVIASLHQPRFSVYSMLDKLLVLRRGQLIYGGDRVDSLNYVGSLGFVPQEGENPADFYIEIAFGFVESTATPKVVPDDLAGKWSERFQALQADALAARATGKCSRGEFKAWFRKTHGSLLSSAVADEVWAMACDAKVESVESVAALVLQGAGHLNADVVDGAKQVVDSVQTLPGDTNRLFVQGAEGVAQLAQDVVGGTSPSTSRAPAADDEVAAAETVQAPEPATLTTAPVAAPPASPPPSPPAAATSDGARRGAELEVDWAQLHHVMDTWHVVPSASPSRLRQLCPLMMRYLTKEFRGRRKLFSYLWLVYGLGMLCGFLRGPDAAINTMVIFATFSAAGFSTIAGAITLSSLGNTVMERDLFAHEAFAGVSQAAEGTVRFISDFFLIILPIGPMFSLPLEGLTASHAGTSRLLSIYVLTAWALSSIGYFCAIVFPSAPAVANTAICFLFCIFLSGPMGLEPKNLLDSPGLSAPFASSPPGHSTDGYGLFAIIPGFWTLGLNLYANMVTLPFAQKRSYILSMLQTWGFVPGEKWNDADASAAAVRAYEREEAQWLSAGLLALFLFGAIIRLIVIAIFVLRNWDLSASNLKRRLRSLGKSTPTSPRRRSRRSI